MLVHAGLIDDALMLWAERESQTTSRATQTYGLDARAMRACFARIADAAAIDVANRSAIKTVVAWLPTSGSAGGASAARSRPVIAPRTIRAARLDPAAGLALLGACSNRALLDDEIAIGSDLAYWTSVVRFAAEIVVAQHYVPAVGHRFGADCAVWQPLLDARERRRAAALAAAMPPACRALTSTAEAAPAANPAAVLDTALAIFVDAFVRRDAPPAPRGVDRSLHARWLSALRSHDATLSAPPAEFADLTSSIAAWQRPLVEERASSYRLCLRVEEPAGDDEQWRITYHLQSHADLSLLVDADTAMRTQASRRELLAALGKAAAFSPEVDESLRTTGTGVPAGFTLDTRAVFAFLTAGAPAFEAAEIGVILPSWWLGMDTKARLALRGRAVARKALASGMLSKLSVLEVNWTVALGDATLSAAELARIAKLKTPLVKIRGRWVHVDADEIRRALERLKRGGSREITLGDAVALRGGAAVGDLPAGTIIEADDVVEDVIARVRGDRALTRIRPPAGLRATLRPYQQRGLDWLHLLTHTGFGACLADDMGLGKTVQTLALVLHDWTAGERGPVLLVCPTSVIANWSREAERFAPSLPILVHHGGDRDRGAVFARNARQQAIVITSYALMQRDVTLLAKIGWRGIVLDEAQNIKNADSKGAAAARAIDAGYRVALTGTPVENHVGDLWSIMHFLNPGMLGSAAAFKREYFLPIQALGDPAAAARLRDATGPFVLRRLKTDTSIIADLPAKTEYKVYCTLTREQASLYAAVLRDLDITLDETAGIKRRGQILAALSKLKQICNHPAQFAGDNSALPGRSGKLARLEEMLDEVLQSGEAALVFTQFAEMGTLIARRLRARFGLDVALLHGGVSKRARDEMVERFSRERGPAVFVLSLKAGGSGLNLTRANHVFHFDRWWNPAVERQATDRAFRIGQRKDVQVHKFICGGTLEDKIDALIDQKQAISERVVGTGEAWLTELSSAQLRDLVALAPEAVGE
jgi:superfamily II DNA or RNA helicase